MTDYNPTEHALISYADETGHSKDPLKQFVGIAGLLAPSTAWMAFDREWRHTCAEEAITLPFHMTEFASRRGQFSDVKWREESNRRRVLGKLVQAIARTAAIPIGAVVPIADFNALSELQRTMLGGDPYYVAFQQCTVQMAFANAPDEVSMIYARQREFTGMAQGLWEAIKDGNLFGLWMGSFAAGEPRDHTPLQAADLWAYELGRHFGYVLPNGLQWRWAFQRLVDQALQWSHGHRFFTLCDRPFMLEALGEVEN